MLRRPGHEQCTACHQADFEKGARTRVCEQCHNATPSRADLLPFPRYKGTRAILIDFSHAKHMDAKLRTDPSTGFRADCSFCHRFKSAAAAVKFPAHDECAACHSKSGMKPRLAGAAGESECQGCHNPEDIENPEPRPQLAAYVLTGKYGDIKFSHAAHFRVKNAYPMDCTTCHASIPESRGLADLALPAMTDCLACHDTSKKLAAQFRMSNCATCHTDPVSGVAPPSHLLGVKPPSHTESFRTEHSEAAAESGAKCFACHQNVTPSVGVKNQCLNCHQVMRPASHTARWRDDIHGKFAAIDRLSCATCHGTDYCIRCHNELPRSHQPLPLFKGGAHAQLAMLNQRACLTCHTFENTCAKCHARSLR